jgi:hypothetical protein
LYESGASYVILPHFLGGQHLGTMIEDFKLDTEKFLKEKIEHIKYLENRHKRGEKHPKYH